MDNIVILVSYLCLSLILHLRLFENHIGCYIEYVWKGINLFAYLYICCIKIFNNSKLLHWSMKVYLYSHGSNKYANVSILFIPRDWRFYSSKNLIRCYLGYFASIKI